MNILLLGPHGMHTVGKVLGLLKVRQLALHPDGIAVRRIRHGAVDGTVAAALQPEVSLARPRRIPVEVDLDSQARQHRARLGIALTLGARQVLGLEGGLVARGAGVDGCGHGVVEALQVGGGEPVILDALQLGTQLSGLLGGDHEVVQGLQLGVG